MLLRWVSSTSERNDGKCGIGVEAELRAEEQGEE